VDTLLWLLSQQTLRNSARYHRLPNRGDILVHPASPSSAKKDDDLVLANSGVRQLTADQVLRTLSSFIVTTFAQASPPLVSPHDLIAFP
jgi:hypothetical protein